MAGEENRALRALQTAIDLCGGSRRELARRITESGYQGVRAPISPQRIDNWLNRDGYVPVDVAPFVAAAVADQVSVFDLVPRYERGWQLLRRQLNAEARRLRREARETL